METDTETADTATLGSGPDTGSTPAEPAAPSSAPEGGADSATQPGETDGTHDSLVAQSRSLEQQANELLANAINPDLSAVKAGIAAAKAGAAPAAPAAPAAQTPPTAPTIPYGPPPRQAAPQQGQDVQAFLEQLKDPQRAQQVMNQLTLAGRQAEELGQLRALARQFQGVDPNQVQALIQRQQQQAQLEGLKPWNPRHPQAATAQRSIDRFSAFQAAANSVPEDMPNRNAVLTRMAEQMGVTADDGKLYRDWQEANRSFQADFTRDPEGYIANKAAQIAQTMVQQELARYDEYQRLGGMTNEFIAQHRDVLASKADTVAWAMNHPARREVGVRMAALEAENERLRQQIQESSASVETARARDQITKQRAATPRDARTASTRDPAAALVNQGVKDPAAIMRALTEARAAT